MPIGTGNSSISASIPEPSPIALALQEASTSSPAILGLAPGTGFLPAETEARKRLPAAPETHRDRNAKEKARDVAAETGIRQGNVEGVVSRDWVVADAVFIRTVSWRKFPVSGKNTGRTQN
jgi:hypothetical protein